MMSPLYKKTNVAASDWAKYHNFARKLVSRFVETPLLDELDSGFYKTPFIYCPELAPGTVSLMGDRVQGEN